MKTKLILVTSVVVLAACSGGEGQTQTCSPETCSGCCDGDNCVPGDAAGACGVGGAFCSDCLGSGQQCGADGACTGGAGGGTGGSSSAGGGNGGGGTGGSSSAGGGGGGGGMTCSAPLSACAGTCVDLKLDAQNCGTCGKACTAGAACSNGQCQTLPADCTATPCPSLGYYCDLGSKQCKAGCVLDGQCGGTLNKCDVATRTCGCQPGSCGTANYCTPQRTCAPGCEAHSQCAGALNQCNLSTHACVCSANSCPSGQFCGGDGSCKTGCGMDSQCTSANENVCSPSSHVCECNSGFHKCGSACVSNTALTSCGSSCTPCPAPPAHATAVCATGACGFECDPGWFKSGNACFPMQPVAATTSAGQEYTCRIQSGGLSCTSFITSPPNDLVYLAASYNVMCGVTSAGGVKCAGRSNNGGELGLGSTVNASSVFTALTSLPANVVKVSNNNERGFALSATGQVARWGRGWQAGSTVVIQPAYTPTPFFAGTPVVDFGLGEDFLCVVLANSPDSITCYGVTFNENVQQVYSGKTVPGPAGGGVSFAKLAFADEHGCAISTTGKVYCWGDASGCKLGYSTTDVQPQPLVAVPNFPPAGRTAVSIAVTSFHDSCAVLDNGDLYCWGQIGSPATCKSTPQKMTAYPNAVSVHSNRQQICLNAPNVTGCFNP